MLGNPMNNWAHKLESTDFVRVRQLMIDCVLATDMSQHFKEVNHIKDRMAKADFSLDNEKDKLMILKFTFHLADISNPVKKWEICRDWTDLLYVEFFSQGDLELKHNFPISYLYDRHTTNIAKSQLGFMDFIIKPSYQIIAKVSPDLEFLIEQMELNKQSWTLLFDEYEAKMNKGNYYMNEIVEARKLPGCKQPKHRRQAFSQEGSDPNF